MSTSETTKDLDGKEEAYNIDELFEKVDVNEYKENVKNLSVILWGQPETGKTYMSLTFPKPIWFFDLDNGVEANLKYLDEKDEIHRIHCVTMDEKVEDVMKDNYNAFAINPIKSLQKFDAAIAKLIESVHGGTVVVDTMSDVNEWLKLYLEAAIPKSTSAKGVEYRNQFDWKYVNQKWLWLWQKLKAIDANLVVIAKSKPVYQDGDLTGDFEPDLRQGSAYQASVIIECINEISTENGSVTKTRYAKFDKFRGSKFAHKYKEKDLTYKRIVEIIKSEKV